MRHGGDLDRGYRVTSVGNREIKKIKNDNGTDDDYGDKLKPGDTNVETMQERALAILGGNLGDIKGLFTNGARSFSLIGVAADIDINGMSTGTTFNLSRK